MDGTHLTGLDGSNPLGFLAALGVQVAFVDETEPPTLWWSDDIVPHAIVDHGCTCEQIADKALSVFRKWRDSPAMLPVQSDGSAIPKGDELKLKPANLRTYLSQADSSGPSGALMTALVAEGSLDGEGVAKPSDLYFTAGQQKFLSLARQILCATREEVLEGLLGPWSYGSTAPSLGWDVTDDRAYALRASNPSGESKETNPGPEALAILGLSLHPVFPRRNRTLTQGCDGKWKNGNYCWPLWHKPASANSVRSLLAHASGYGPASKDRRKWYRAWGVSRILSSPIRRSAQGGYGTFGPPETLWRAEGT